MVVTAAILPQVKSYGPGPPTSSLPGHAAAAAGHARSPTGSVTMPTTPSAAASVDGDFSDPQPQPQLHVPATSNGTATMRKPQTNTAVPFAAAAGSSVLPSITTLLDEAVAAVGDFAGSVFVDRAFEACYGEEVGRQAFDAWRARHPADWQLVLDHWEQVRAVGGFGWDGQHCGNHTTHSEREQQLPAAWWG